jgi:hypothetical protein
MSIDAAGLGPIGIVQNKTLILPWGKDAGPSADPFAELEVRKVIHDDVSLVSTQTGPDKTIADAWGSNLDDTAGRALRGMGSLVNEKLKGGQENLALAARFDSATKSPQSLDITSETGNYTKHVLWDANGFKSSSDERVLADGSREVLSLQVDSAKGTLTYVTSLVPATSSSATAPASPPPQQAQQSPAFQSAAPTSQVPAQTTSSTVSVGGRPVQMSADEFKTWSVMSPSEQAHVTHFYQMLLMDGNPSISQAFAIASSSPIPPAPQAAASQPTHCQQPNPQATEPNSGQESDDEVQAQADKIWWSWHPELQNLHGWNNADGG